MEDSKGPDLSFISHLQCSLKQKHRCSEDFCALRVASMNHNEVQKKNKKVNQEIENLMKQNFTFLSSV